MQKTMPVSYTHLDVYKRQAFPHPEQLMENIAGVTGFLKKKIIARGGDPERETLNIIPTVDNKPY